MVLLGSLKLWESLGLILNNIVNPPRTLADIAKDYREAQMNFESSNSSEAKSFWRSMCNKLSTELEEHEQNS